MHSVTDSRPMTFEGHARISKRPLEVTIFEGVVFWAYFVIPSASIRFWMCTLSLLVFRWWCVCCVVVFIEMYLIITTNDLVLHAIIHVANLESLSYYGLDPTIPVGCKPFIWLRLRASLALCQFWLLPVFSSWLCQFGCSRKVVNCQIGCLELYSAQTSIDCRLMYTLQNSYIPIPCNERYCVPQVSIRIGSTLFSAS